MDRGAWWATIHGVTKSQTQLSTQGLFLDLANHATKWIISVMCENTVVLVSFFNCYFHHTICLVPNRPWPGVLLML